MVHCAEHELDVFDCGDVELQQKKASFDSSCKVAVRSAKNGVLNVKTYLIKITN